MRVIKFRFFDTISKNMHSMDRIQDYNLEQLHRFSSIDDPYTKVMQFTGLKDRNKIDIFDGDILSIYFHDVFSNECINIENEGEHNPIVKVHWDYSGYWLFSEGDSTWYLPQSLDECGEFEIIGNIHQNPELIINT